MLYAVYQDKKWVYPLNSDFVDAKGEKRTMEWLRKQSAKALAQVGVFPVELVQAVPPRGAVERESLLEFVDGKLRVTPQFKIDAEKAKQELMVEADLAHEKRCEAGVRVNGINFPFTLHDIMSLWAGKAQVEEGAESVTVVFSTNQVYDLKRQDFLALFDRAIKAYAASLAVKADQYEQAGSARFRSVVLEATPASASKPVEEPPVFEQTTTTTEPTTTTTLSPVVPVVPPVVTKPGPVYEILDDDQKAFSGYLNSLLRRRGSEKVFDDYVTRPTGLYARAIGPFRPQDEDLIRDVRSLLPAGPAYDIVVTRYETT